MRKTAVPSADEAIGEVFAAGDRQCALELLDAGERDVRKERCLIDLWAAGQSRMIGVHTMDLTRLRQTLENSLAELTPELRQTIARRLLDADTD
jgi:hypothetical protein